MSHYLVTGGAGFIGSHVVEALLAAGHRVRVIDNLIGGSRANLAPQAEFVEGDILDEVALDKACEGIEGIFHLAALPQVQYSVEFPLESHRVNVDGTLSVFRAAIKAKIPRVVFSSTCAVYGTAKVLPTPVGAELDPISPYALQKRVCEEYAELWHALYGLEVVCLRYFNVYGLRMPITGSYAGAIALFGERRRQGKPLGIYGDGENTRDFVHVSDVAQANIAAMEHASFGKSMIFNVGTGVARSINEVAKRVGGEIQYLPPRQGDPRAACADIRATQEALGWSPRVPFDEGLEEYLRSLSL